ncbi:MAG TPA: hypothetical protein VFV46_12055 [Lacibacter sp.]|nr:hypothetical protein [Lacibacter sp.]
MNIVFNNSIKNKVVSKNALIKQKRTYALSAIWIFVFITVINVYFTNVQYLTENSDSRGLNPTLSISDNKSIVNSDNNTGNQNYALVQYNKKLILTRFTGIIAQSNNANLKGNKGSNNTSKAQSIIVIKNQQYNKPAKNNEFSVKPIPNN